MTTSGGRSSSGSSAKRGISRSRTKASASTVARVERHAVDSSPSYSTATIDRPSPRSMRTGRRVSITPAVDLPRRQDRVVDALVGQQPQGRQVDGGLGQPHPDGRPAEAHLEVAQAPADLGPPVGADASGRIAWWNGWAMPFAPRIAVDEPAVRDRVAVPRASPRASARGPTTSRRGCRARRSGGSSPRDPLVPVVGGGRRRVRGIVPVNGSRPRRLVEVAVDDERGAAHVASSAAGRASGRRRPRLFAIVRA